MILISIVGDFYSSILPLFYEFHTQLNHHIIVYDDARSDEIKANKIAKGTRRFCEKNNLPIRTTMLKIDEDSMKGVHKVIQFIDSLDVNLEEVYINATDGLSNIALLLSHAYLDDGMVFLSYDRYDNTYNFVQYQHMQTYKLQHTIPIKEHFMLKDIAILSMSDLNIAHRYEQTLVELFEGFHGEVNALVEVYHQDTEFLLTQQTGFLYEFYIYNLIKNLNHDGVAVGVKVSDTYSSKSEIINEFDILIMKQNHLHMIECKFQTNPKKVELVYKVDSVRSTLDDESKIMILSDEAVYDLQKDSTTPHISGLYKRANSKKIY
jgi:hypothetical protein